KQQLKAFTKEKIEIPCIIGGKEISTGRKQKCIMPHDHHSVLGEYHQAGPEELKMAVQAALKAKTDWESLSWENRAAIFLKAAELISGPYRDKINAATMLCQSKNVYQAEIDAACELIDFFKFNAFYYQRFLRDQPLSTPPIWNQMDYRPLEGFVVAITPFNFTAISGNLPTTPALVGNTVIWKPSHTQVYSAFCVMKILQEAGLPDGVINFAPTTGSLISQILFSMPELAGIHFTGSTFTFQNIYKTIGQNIHNYRSYPRIVGETGGKDFVFAHASCDIQALVAALIRGAFEYQGQKCSAASRAYIPKSIWSRVQELLVSEIKTICIGDVRDFKNFVNAVIDQESYSKINNYIEDAKNSNEAKILIGGGAKSEVGYFIEPTVIVTTNPKYKTMVEEVFGPVLSIFIYDDTKYKETLKLCDETSAYALTGAIFAQDRNALVEMSNVLRHAAGNLYINDKPTGAVVGQQPFGGARASGTNDKAGSILNLLRWVSPRVIKENFVPPKDFRYPFMKEE
ncbi:MAG: L-glutamate gamma-semialdehyde dehydrogenase, partial [Bdellovibrio sp.]|nr:L-glutamate gamma-semialdehyde dehydrogenase [Bdellovibrio sp.]